MYAFVIVIYIGGISLFVKSVWHTLQKGGPMHEVSIHGIHRIYTHAYLIFLKKNFLFLLFFLLTSYRIYEHTCTLKNV